MRNRNLLGLCLSLVLLFAGVILPVFHPLDPRSELEKPPGGVVFFCSDPPGAEVRQANFAEKAPHRLGQTVNEKIPLDELDGKDDVRFEIALAGYETQRFTVPRNELYQGIWPPPKADIIRLKPTGPLGYLSYLFHYRKLPATLSVVGLLGFLGFGTALLRAFLRGRVLESYRAKADPEHRFVGHKISDYRLVEWIGGGAFGQVYRALTDLTLNESKPVAIKVVPPAPGVSSERIEQELEICRGLNHPNIIRYHESGSQEGLLFLVMELVPGVELASMIPEEGMPVAQAIDILSQLEKALSYAHQQGIIHRDVKPENVLVTQDGTLKMLDFGLAKDANSIRSITMTGEAFGTPIYMAPEQLHSSKHVDPRADIYAFGAVAYELLGGVPPFVTPGQPTDHMQLLATKMSSRPEPLSQRKPEFQGAVSDAVQKMLSPEPTDRPETLSEAFQELLSALKQRV